MEKKVASSRAFFNALPSAFLGMLRISRCEDVLELVVVHFLTEPLDGNFWGARIFQKHCWYVVCIYKYEVALYVYIEVAMVCAYEWNICPCRQDELVHYHSKSQKVKITTNTSLKSLEA
jgi:hypothetical protein